ncbi:MAG: MoxR family ATPase, partial [Kiritimatiellae bacterium]|nr:MoxR family ATPase [Kiritimatiellia bacterium]MDW8459142.1 MoxR family ATPase [Verrucomicrobiota bacterium]
ALLEAMQERQVTIGQDTFQLPKPFLVMATQNPIEQEGTYPLPEAQVDRFMMKLVVTYPTREEERRILDLMARTDAQVSVRPVVDPPTLLRARSVVDDIYVDEKIKDYILSIIFATRDPASFKLDLKPYIRYGASPRATLNLTIAARSHAFLHGRGYVIPQDVKSLAPDVLRHRIIVSYEAEAEQLTSDDIIHRILSSLPVP